MNVILQSLHLAGKPLPAKSVTAPALAKALREMAATDRYPANAQQFSEQMQKQDGVSQAVQLIAERLTKAN